MIEIAAPLLSMGYCVEELSRSDAARWWQGWCSTFCGTVKAREGRFAHRGHHWHAFSDGLVRALSGHAARKQYVSLGSATFFVVPEDWSCGYGVRASGLSMPDLAFLTNDLYVFPESLEWSMVFTHEHDYGPYFTWSYWCSVPAN